MLRTRSILLALPLIFAAACGASCPSLPHTNPALALEEHRGTRAGLSSLRAEARVEQWGSAGRIRGTVMMFIERPDRVRFDAMTQFGPAAILTSDGDNFALTDMRENRFFSGPACSSNIARLLGIPLSGAEVLNLLVGDTPRLESVNEGIRCDREGHYVVTRTADDGASQELAFSITEQTRSLAPEDQELRLVRSEVFSAEGQTVWRATWADYREVADPQAPGTPIVLPFRVRFEHLELEADTEVRFQSISPNLAIPEGAFHQDPRPGLPAEHLACTP